MTPPTTLPLAGLLLLLALASAQILDPSVKDLSQRSADFAGRLYRAVSSRTDDNVFLCPLTLAAALAALLNVTSGPTQDQLMRGLSLVGLDPETLPDVFLSLRTEVLQSSGMDLKLGVAVLPAMGFPVSSSYMNLVQTKFGGNAQNLAYTMPHEAAGTINRWAQDRTGEKVQQLVTNLDPQTQLLLAAVASYRAQFSPAFNASFTQDERFYVDRYHVVMAPMMFRADKYFLAYDRSLKVGVLKLPMVDGAAMLVLLPDEDVEITTVEEEVTGEKIRAWIRQLKKTKLEVQLPRFLLERSYSLRDDLQTLDITQVFEDSADIINMGESKGPKLTQVYHKSVLSVDESSDDVTAGGGVSVFTSPPPRLTINRPFIFIIYHQMTSSVLFMGRVTDPTKK